MSIRAALVQQSKLLNSIRRDISLHKLRLPKEVVTYEKKFLSELPRKSKPSSLGTLSGLIKSHQIILLGDFHTFRLSQKSVIKLINASALPSTKVAIALECVRITQQSKLDHYLAGHITLLELVDELNFERYWPFPQEGFLEIFRFAKDNKISLLALDHGKNTHGDISLKVRDKAAALTLLQYRNINPSKKIFTLIGEHHLSKSHLPNQIRNLSPQAKVLVLHQNIPQVFLRCQKISKGNPPAEVQRLSKNEFCLLNTVPWIKYKSYLNWLEGSIEDEWTSHSVDPNSIRELSSIISIHLGKKVSKENILELISAPQEIRHLEKRSKYKKIVKWARENGRPALIPDSGSIVCPSEDPNSMAETAALSLAFSQKSPKFVLTTLITGYFGSKILNPKRKCSTINDVNSFIKKSKKKSKEWQSYKAALGILGGKLSDTQYSKVGSLDLVACRLAGYILGESLYRDYASGKNSLAAKYAMRLFPFQLNEKEESNFTLQLLKINAKTMLPSKEATL